MGIFFIFLSVIFTALIFEISVFPNFFSSFSAPDLATVILAIFVIEFGLVKIWKWVILGGVFFDVLLFSPLGLHVSLFLFLAGIFHFFSRIFIVGQRTRKYSTASMLVFFGAFFGDFWTDFFISFYDYFFQSQKFFAGDFFDFNFWKSLYSVILLFFLYAIFRKISKTLFLQRKEIKLN